MTPIQKQDQINPDCDRKQSQWEVTQMKYGQNPTDHLARQQQPSLPVIHPSLFPFFGTLQRDWVCWRGIPRGAAEPLRPRILTEAGEFVLCGQEEAVRNANQFLGRNQSYTGSPGALSLLLGL